MQSSITFFSSTPSPPVVYEFVIDEFLNVNIKKIYEVKSDDVLRYTGNDKIWANEKYVAFLLYDYRSLRQVVRVFYRDETNFGVGHSNIVLSGFNFDVGTMKFLEFKNNDAIYLRNAQKWKVYKLNEIEFILDTYTNDSTISPYLLNSYEIKITWFHELLLDKNLDKVELSFNISFTNSSDMDLHFIGDSNNKSIINSYGDPSFKIRINDYYMGPNLIFGFELISSVPYGPNITLPKVFNTYDKSISEFQLNSNYPWNRVLSSRFTHKGSQTMTLSLKCIYDNYIERYSLSASGRFVRFEEQKEYITSHFIDYQNTICRHLYKFIKNYGGLKY